MCVCIVVFFLNREKVTKKTGSSSSEDEEEKQRVKDLSERDAFAKRLIDNDSKKRRNVMSKSEKKV